MQTNLALVLRRCARPSIKCPQECYRRESLEFLCQRYASLREAAPAESACEQWLSEPGLSPADRERANRMLDPQRAPSDGTVPAQTTTARVLRAIAILALLLFLFMLWWAAGWRWLSGPALREAFRPSRIALLAYVFLPPAGVAFLYDAAAIDAFGTMALSSVPIALLAQAAAPVVERGRVGLAVSVAAAQLGLAALVFVDHPALGQ